MEVLIVFEDSSKSDFGGGQRVTMDFLESVKLKFEKILIFDFTINNKTTFTQKLNNSGFQIHHLFTFGRINNNSKSSYSISALEIILFPVFLFINAFVIFNAFRKKNDRRLFYATTKKALIYSLLFSNKDDMILFHIHNSHKKSILGKLFRRLIRIKRITCVAVSEFVKHTYDLEKIKVVYNGVKKIEFENKSSFGINPIKVAFVGSLIKWKGVEILLQSLPLIDDLKIEIHVFGDGFLRKNLEEIYRFDERVVFRGFVDNILQVLVNEIDILCLPSVDSEACPMSVIEAISVGIPVITTNIGGQREIIQNGGGILVNVNSSTEIAQGIREISNNFQMYHQNAKANSSKYSYENFSLQISNIIDSIRRE